MIINDVDDDDEDDDDDDDDDETFIYVSMCLARKN